MATHLVPFPDSQWSIDYQSAVLEPDSSRRALKTDEAVTTCIDALLGGLLCFEERFAIRIAMQDLIVLRCSYYKYELANLWNRS